MSSHRIVGSAKEKLVIQSSLSGIRVQSERVYDDVKFNIEALLIL